MTRTLIRRMTRDTCGTWMPKAKAPCARRPGHTTEHRSPYALDNLLARRRRERGVAGGSTFAVPRLDEYLQ